MAEQWFKQSDWQPYDFQVNTWDAIGKGYSGLLNAPTGFGKTYAIWFGVLQQYYKKQKPGIHCLWITPLRALSKEIYMATERVSDGLGLSYTIGLRSGDTSLKERTQQKKKMPNGLITTPESVHLLLAAKGYNDTFKNLQFVIIDEWHELMGTKRGVQIELALSRLKAINPELKIWGISATIGNLEEAEEVLLGGYGGKRTMIRTNLKKRIEIETIIPEVIEKYPWGGHLGIKLMEEVLPIIHKSNSTLLFTNTRSQCEIWYQRLLEREPDLAGAMALHHSALSDETRLWVENALHEGILKAVVCTSSLDLGVDFRPVDTVIQIGSPKGVARFMQRAGRSGHQPGAISKIYFLPTHSLEIIEGSALRHAVTHSEIEQRVPYIRSFDVLIQYLVTLAVSDGFRANETYEEVIKTHCFNSVTREEFNWCLLFITDGGSMLEAYDEFHKVVIENGLYVVTSKRVAMRHRLGIGTIVSDAMIQVTYVGGGRIGSIEEWFISRLSPGDSFWFTGKNLELIRIKDMTAYVKRSAGNKGAFPSWQGGRMPLSSQLSSTIRMKLDEYGKKKTDIEISSLSQLFEEQKMRSHLPHNDELLIEKIKTRDGYHVFFYPFEGRNVHEGMASLFAYRISQIKPMTFSIAMNDYGFELLSDQEIPVEEALGNALFDSSNISADIYASVNISEMAKRKFRDIATIAGLVFNGYPGKAVKTRHVQANSQLFFGVFTDFDPNNLLLQQAYDEVMTFQMEQVRMMQALQRMETQHVIIKDLEKFSPFCFPILTERFREKFTNEKFEDRVKKMLEQLDRA
ncbi:DNA ligase-associated DEXH box helicase [Flavipsychrobacter stenotrophus]|uniref:DNA ligase-associated DEXH box helicase n=1 Tax=Flavipsychrobacter stenotrophus TaxID=2077091 RepID=A0A2S7SQJ7_9BACT|nr:DNA ligase-associated DEXH box helicase [Flavipsychrobacter stenotrophus]